MALPPIPATPGKKVDPRQRRIMYAVAGGAVLALIFLLQRRGGAAADAPAAIATPQPDAATFADNGEQAAALGDAVSGALGDQALAFGDLTAAVEALAATQAANQSQPNNPAGAPPAEPPAAAPAIAAAATATATRTVKGQTQWFWNGNWHTVPQPVAKPPNAPGTGVAGGRPVVVAPAPPPAPTVQRATQTRVVKGKKQWYWHGNWHTVPPR